jgi:hypothetical protein
MKKFFFILVLLLSLFLSSGYSKASAIGLTGNINLLYGTKMLHGWSEFGYSTDINRQKLKGINVDLRLKSWPINIVVGSSQTSADSDYSYKFPAGRYFGTAHGFIKEMEYGLKKIWDPSPFFHTFLGAGIALVDAEITYEGTTIPFYNGTTYSDFKKDSGHATCLWIDTGIYMTVANHFNIGIEFGYSKGDTDLKTKIQNQTVSAGGFKTAFFTGFHF